MESLHTSINTKFVISPEIDLDSQPIYIVEEGVKYIRYDRRAADSGQANLSAIRFSFVAPSKNIVVDRVFRLDLSVRFTFVGQAGNGNLLMQEQVYGNDTLLASFADGLRQFPIHSVSTSMVLQLNSTTFSWVPNFYIHALTKYGYNKDSDDSFLSVGPSMPDFYQEYSDALLFGLNRAPNNQPGNNPAQMTRNGFKYNIVSNTQTSAVIDVEWQEVIMMSPLSFQKMLQKGFIKIDNISLTINLDASNLSRMWSHAYGVNVDPNTGFDVLDPNNNGFSNPPSVTFNRTPQLAVRYLTPNLSNPVRDIVYHYPYYDISHYSSTNNTVLAQNVSETINANNIQLHTIPNKIYIFAKQRYADLTIDSSDTYARINDLKVQFNNKDLLTSANIQDLYYLSQNNGYSGSFAEFQNFSGSVICLDWNHDISMDDFNLVGQTGNWDYQTSANITNISKNEKIFELWQIVISEGIWSVGPGTQSFTKVGGIVPFDLLQSQELSSLQRINYYDIHDYTGGNFLSKLKKWGSNIIGIAKKGLYGAEKALPYIQQGLKLGEKYLPQKFKTGVEKAIGFAEEYGPEATKILETVAPLLAAGYSTDEIFGMGMTGGKCIKPRKKLLNRR